MEDDLVGQLVVASGLESMPGQAVEQPGQSTGALRPGTTATGRSQTLEVDQLPQRDKLQPLHYLRTGRPVRILECLPVVLWSLQRGFRSLPALGMLLT